MEQPGESRLESFLLDSAGRDRRLPRGWRRAVLIVFAVLLAIGGWWSRTPDALHVVALPDVQGRTSLLPGLASTAMLRATVGTLLEKPGGYTSNDLLPPGIWLDNMPAFERGALRAVRDMLRAMRRDFSHAAAVAVEDPDLQRAEARFLYEGGNWLTTETEYREGLLALDNYYRRLDDPAQPGARFYPRSDALARWLADVDIRLDEHIQRLAAATRNDAARTEWSGIDDAFFEARGYAWALRAQQEAMLVDFADVLANANGARRLQQAMLQLDGTQQPVRSPLIMNGSEFGVLANHSLVMAGYLAATRSELQQLRAALREGTATPP